MVLPWSAAKELPNLWISPIGLIPQEARRPRLIYDYTFSGLNNATVRQAPSESIQFGNALERLLAKILSADPVFGPVFLAKVDLSDAYMRVWLRAEDVPRLAFVVPPRTWRQQTPHWLSPVPANGLRRIRTILLYSYGNGGGHSQRLVARC